MPFSCYLCGMEIMLKYIIALLAGWLQRSINTLLCFWGLVATPDVKCRKFAFRCVPQRTLTYNGLKIFAKVPFFCYLCGMKIELKHLIAQVTCFLASLLIHLGAAARLGKSEGWKGLLPCCFPGFW